MRHAKHPGTGVTYGQNKSYIHSMYDLLVCMCDRRMDKQTNGIGDVLDIGNVYLAHFERRYVDAIFKEI